MSEVDRTPSIRLSVDQEVFIDTVREHDSIEDATVATEVTSFERVGDAYVLEGAIVFAGYLARPGAGGAPREAGDIASEEFADEPYAQHIHHRMPFVLRVPIRAQPRGIVNVASRIPSWRLEVLGAGWVRVVAELHIVGLNGNGGYHFQCGAQEMGDLFFAESERAGDAANWAAGDLQVPLAEPAAGASETHPSTADMRGKVERVSAARRGHGSGGQGAGDDAVVGQSRSVHDELLSLDRAVDGHRTRELDADSSSRQERRQDAPPQAESARADESGEPLGHSDEEVSQFEFEYQVSASDPYDVKDPDARPEEEFVASRGFGEDGFRPAAGFVPNIHVGSRSDNESAAPAGRGEWSYGSAEPAEQQLTVDPGLWSFVDFSRPENYCTLRYVIVLEDETLDSIAERLRCSKADLLRINRLTTDAVRPGQPLRVPEPGVRAGRLTQDSVRGR